MHFKEGFTMTRIYSNELKEGLRYSAPLFFDDGANMFLAKRKVIKKYHIDILKKWAIPFILTYGTVIDNDDDLLDFDEEDEVEVMELLEDDEEQQSNKIKIGNKNFDKANIDRVVKNFSINRLKVNEQIQSIQKSLKEVFSAIEKGIMPTREKTEPISDALIKLVKEYPSESINALISSEFVVSYEIKAIISGIIGILMSESLDMKKSEVSNLVLASLFHDIGMISVPKDIREKQTKLTRQEFDLLKLHLIKSARLTTEQLYYPKEVGEIIMQHHERYDGSGYPEGLEKDEISLSARILSLTDTFSAMICRSNYGKPLSGYEAIKEISQKAEKKFDPEILKLFISVLGYYPVGSYVLLNTNHLAQVIKANINYPYQPLVQILSKSPQGKTSINIGDRIKLQDYPELSIVRQIENDKI